MKVDMTAARRGPHCGSGLPEEGDVARRRDTDVPSLRKQSRGDVDWIVLRALEKDRTRRYALALEFAADIERHRADEPVMRSPPSVACRVQKFVRRHRLGVAAAAFVASSPAAGLIRHGGQRGRRLVAVQWWATIGVWDSTTGAKILELKDGTDVGLHEPLFSLDGSQVFAHGRYGDVRVWDIRKACLAAGVRFPNTTGVVPSANGRHVLARRSSGALERWPVAEERP
jgi:hypothetical protein